MSTTAYLVADTRDSTWEVLTDFADHDSERRTVLAAGAFEPAPTEAAADANLTAAVAGAGWVVDTINAHTFDAHPHLLVAAVAR